ncbi:hypothetical protein U525_01854, partial [Staphylococcus aureus F77917]
MFASFNYAYNLLKEWNNFTRVNNIGNDN